MRLWKSWLIAEKDLKLIGRRRSFLVGLIVFPLFVGIGLPVILNHVIVNRGILAPEITNLLGAFGFFFVLLSVFLPLYISSYSLVGEKIEHSLEPLLSTPTSDGEILVGKYIGVFIPVIIAIYIGTVIFMILSDVFTSPHLGYNFFPNWSFGIIVLVTVPLANIYAISFSVFISSKVNNTQSAYQLGVFSVAPFIILYVMGELGIVSLSSNNNILIISGALFVMAVAMFFISRATFNRDEILTSWK